MRNGPFGYTETAADRFIREEFERTRQYRDALGGGAAAEAIRQATKQRELLRGLDLVAPYRSALDTLERDRKQQEELRRLTSTAWALSVTQTARSVVERHNSLVEDQRRLSNSFLNTVRTYDANRSVIETAMAAATAGETYRRMIAEAMPSMSIFSAIAERMRLIDLQTLRASDDPPTSATAIAAEMVIEVQRIATAIVEAPTEEEGARLYGSLLDTLLNFIKNLGPNTIPELNKMGLVSFATFIITIMSAYALIPQEDFGPQEKAAFAELNEKVDRLQEDDRHYHEAAAESEKNYVADLPQAELVRDATFRQKPSRDGSVVLKAPKGTKVAISRSEGRWRMVIFRDQLSEQLAQAWVYAPALASLAPPLAIDE